MDRRRRQYVPIAVTLPHKGTGLKLRERFGRDGLLVWILFLSACKTNWIQGQFSYTSEADGWSKLGLYDDTPEFTLETFFTYTGQLKKTSRRRSGHLTDVLCTRWGDWNEVPKRAREAERMSRKRAGNTANTRATIGQTNGNYPATEVEVENEEEVEGYDQHEPANAARRSIPRGVTRDGLSSRDLRPDACPACEIVAGHTADCPTQRPPPTAESVEEKIRDGTIATRPRLDEELVGADLEPGQTDHLYELLDSHHADGRPTEQA